MKKRNEEKIREEENKIAEKLPKYVVIKPDFYCPLAPSMLWHHGLYYKECPLKASERDMSSCGNCNLKYKNVEKATVVKKERNNYKKDSNALGKRQKEEIPVIGKTYVSGEED